jgi:hypothetical protein
MKKLGGSIPQDLSTPVWSVKQLEWVQKKIKGEYE